MRTAFCAILALCLLPVASFAEDVNWNVTIRNNTKYMIGVKTGTIDKWNPGTFGSLSILFPHGSVPVAPGPVSPGGPLPGFGAMDEHLYLSSHSGMSASLYLNLATIDSMSERGIQTETPIQAVELICDPRNVREKASLPYEVALGVVHYSYTTGDLRQHESNGSVGIYSSVFWNREKDVLIHGAISSTEAKNIVYAEITIDPSGE
jgi:hypothetical protein